MAAVKRRKKKNQGSCRARALRGVPSFEPVFKALRPPQKNGALARASDIPNTHNLAQMVVETRPDNDGRN
jgi:hypothetical protein